jgi:hypothetical protein
MKQEITPIEHVSSKILLIQKQKVILDRDIAELYGVETSQLKRAVRRNIECFPKDFMFELTKYEFENLKCYFGISSWGGIRYLPMVFTEQGVPMLASVLRSKKAVEVNILIVRAFVRRRELLYSDKNLALKVEKLEKRMDVQGKSLQQVIQIVSRMFKQPKIRKNKIGFRVKND